MADTATEEEVLEADAVVVEDEPEVTQLLLDDPDAPPPDDEPPIAVDDADVPPPPADDDGGDDDGKRDDDEPEPPKTGVTIINIVLFALNFIAVLAFGYFLLQDYHARHLYSFAVLQHDLAMRGLPLEEEASGVSGSRELEPPRTIDPAALEKAFGTRRTGTSLKERFAPPPEMLAPRIAPDQLSPDTLKVLFEPVGGNSVKTLQDEIKNVQKDLQGKIDTAADELAQSAKDATAKRALLTRLLYPLAYTTTQVDALQEAIAAAKEADLDALVAEAARRKITRDILAAIDEYSPLPTDQYILPMLVTLQAGKDKGLTVERFIVDSDQVKKALADCITSSTSAQVWDGTKSDSLSIPQGTTAKRRNVAYLLYTLSQVEKPRFAPPAKGEEKADGPDTFYSPKRAEVIVGTYEFTQAAETYALALTRLEQKQRILVERDRGQGILPFEFRVHVAEVDFIPEFLALCKEKDIQVPNEKDLTAKLEKFLADDRKELRTSAEQLARFKALLVEAKLELPKDAPAFDREIERLFNGRFVTHLLGLFDLMGIQLPNENAFAAEAKRHFNNLSGKLKDSAQVIAEVKGLMTKFGIVVTEEPVNVGFKVKQAEFDSALARLLDPREIGFVGEHQAMVKRLRDLVRYIEDEDRRLKEGLAQEAVMTKQHDERVEHEKLLRKKLIDARAETRRASEELARLQQQLFLAQRALAEADQNNRRMEQRIRLIEKFKGGSGTP